MQHLWPFLIHLGRHELPILLSLLLVAGAIWAFAVLADEVSEGETHATTLESNKSVWEMFVSPAHSVAKAMDKINDRWGEFITDYSVLCIQFVLMRLSRLPSMKVLHTQEIRIYTSIMVRKQERVCWRRVTPPLPTMPWRPSSQPYQSLR